MITLFGIPNCDTVRKARAWLAARDIAAAFHDYRKDGIDEATVRRWAKEVGWERLLNRNGTTFRRLPDEARADLDEDRAIALMLAYPSAIRRPVVEGAGALLVGFEPAGYAAAFGTGEA